MMIRLPLLVLTLTAAAYGAVNEQAIADVAAGKLKEARASWWGFDPADSTKALQAAINSNVPKLIVDQVGGPWIVTPIRLVSNQEIEFEKGVEVVAKKGEFKGTNDALLSADLKENIILRGHGATLRMQRADYDGPDYTHAEWRHCLSLKSCSNVRVEGLTLAESGGDGIYLGTAKQWVTNLNITIKDVVCDRNYRQGISVITAENLLIENTVMRDTAGTAPMAGIDFEPNHPQERLLNVVMRNCVTENNKGGGFVYYVPNLDASSEQMTIRMENCRAINESRAAFALYTGNRPAGAVRGSVVLTDCELQGGTPAPVVISDKPVKGCELRLERCTIVPVEASTAPIVFMARQEAEEPLGGVELRQCVVRDPVERPAIAVIDMSGGVGVEEIDGVLLVERGGKREEVALTERLLNQWMPSARLKKVPRFVMQGVAFEPVNPAADLPKEGLGSVRVRKTGRFALYAARGEQVTLGIRHQEFVKYTAGALPVMVSAPSGAVACKAAVPFKETAEISFTAPETGLYRVVADPGMVSALVTASSHPINLLADEQPIRLLASPGDYYFYVPAGTREFAVRVMGEGIGEFVNATLTDPTGAVRGSGTNIAPPQQFEITMPEGSPGEIWKLRLDRPTKGAMEDHFVDLRGIPPLLATRPAALLKPVK